MGMKWYLTGIVFLLCGCAEKIYDTRRNELHTEKTVVRAVVSDSGERLVEKDSAIRVSAPVEESKNEVMDSSYLSTSLAWSEAVCKNGRLRHVIGNFPQITVPAKIVYRDRWRDRRDTLIVRDTVRILEVVSVEKRIKPWWINAAYWCCITLFAGAFGIFMYRKFFRR